MNLSNDLTPTPDPQPLLVALRRHRRLRTARQTGMATIVTACLFTPYFLQPKPTQVASSTATTQPAATKLLTSDDLLDALKTETVAFIRWPDGTQQLLVKDPETVIP